jgi:hypothetical protein
LGLIQKKKKGFLGKKFLTHGCRGRNGIKNYMSDHYEFIDFWWKFYNFWTSGAIKINSEKIKQIRWIDQRLGFDHKPLWVQLGDRGTAGCDMGTKNRDSQNWRREDAWHVTACEQAKSAEECHVSPCHRSTSTQVGPIW